MINLLPPYFFDLSNYQHARLFDLENYVWLALQNLESYLSSLKLGRIEIDIPNGVFIVDPHLVSIGKGTVVEPGAYIKGPCYIGENCTIRQGAYIRGHVLTGEKCMIGHDTEMKHAIMLDNAHAAHFAYVGDSILGNHVNLGAGTKCANLSLDNRPINIRNGVHRIETGFRKLGAIIGDGSQTGCNSVTNPGTLLGKHVHCYPCLNIGGVIPSESLLKPKAPLYEIVKKRI